MIDVEIYDKLTYAFLWLTKTPSSHTPKHRNRSSETKCLRFIFIAHSFERHSRAEDPFLGACVCVCVKNKWVISSQFFASHASTLMFARINTLIVFRIEFAPVHCLYIYFFASFSLRVCVCAFVQQVIIWHMQPNTPPHYTMDCGMFASVFSATTFFVIFSVVLRTRYFHSAGSICYTNLIAFKTENENNKKIV